MTVFGIHGNEFGQGVVYIRSGESLSGLKIFAKGNYLEALEKEKVVKMLPLQFAEGANITISANQSREILAGMGFKLPGRITRPSDVTDILKSTPRLNNSEIAQYLQKCNVESMVKE